MFLRHLIIIIIIMGDKPLKVFVGTYGSHFVLSNSCRRTVPCRISDRNSASYMYLTHFWAKDFSKSFNFQTRGENTATFMSLLRSFQFKCTGKSVGGVKTREPQETNTWHTLKQKFAGLEVIELSTLMKPLDNGGLAFIYLVKFWLLSGHLSEHSYAPDARYVLFVLGTNCHLGRWF